MYVILILSVSIVVSLGYYTLIALNRAKYPDTIRPWRPTRFHAVEVWSFLDLWAVVSKGISARPILENFGSFDTRY